MRSGGIRERASPGARGRQREEGENREAGKIRLSDVSPCGPFFGTRRAVILSPTRSRCVSVCLSCPPVLTCVCASDPFNGGIIVFHVYTSELFVQMREGGRGKAGRKGIEGRLCRGGRRRGFSYIYLSPPPLFSVCRPLFSAPASLAQSGVDKRERGGRGGWGDAQHSSGWKAETGGKRWRWRLQTSPSIHLASFLPPF